MKDAYNLKRFVKAQDSIYQQVLDELGAGQKRGHWMWYVFPQIQGLGYSGMAQTYAITSQQEAAAYEEHEVLGSRLRQCTQLVMAVEGRSLKTIFGYPDDLKFRSAMTLFLLSVADNDLFKDALHKYCEGAPDQLTLDILHNL